MERVLKFEAMAMSDFMMKYKGTVAPNKKNGVNVSYLVITYTSEAKEEKRIVLWAANLREMMYFTDLQHKYQPSGTLNL